MKNIKGSKLREAISEFDEDAFMDCVNNELTEIIIGNWHEKFPEASEEDFREALISFANNYLEYACMHFED